MMENQKIETLEEKFTNLEQRVTLLEEKERTQEHYVQDVAPGEIDFNLMQRLQNRRGEMFEARSVKGSIVYAGDFTNEEAPQAWYVERAIPFIIQQKSEKLAPLLAALGHPQRLAIVQLLLNGPRDRQTLQTHLGIPSTGKFYHHLNSLIENGLIAQRSRGVYGIAKTAAVPLLVILASSIDILSQFDNDQIDGNEGN